MDQATPTGPQLPPYGPIRDVERPGFAVAENAARLTRFAQLERRLVAVAADWLARVPTYECKGVLGLHTYEDAEHHDWLRRRLRELRAPEARAEAPGPGPWREFLLQIGEAADEAELIAGLHRVVKPALIAAYRRHVETTNPLVDAPTCRLLRHILLDEEGHADWGREALLALPGCAGEAAARWQRHLERLLEGAGGIAGDSPVGAAPAEDIWAEAPGRGAAGAGATAESGGSGAPRARARRERVTVPARDPRFEPVLWDPRVPDGDTPADRLNWMMRVRAYEMGVAEAIAATIGEWEGQPWEFYRDAARHLWDEVRHAWFGQAALRALGHRLEDYPNYVGECAAMLEALSPPERYAELAVHIEGGAMKYPPGKREEFEFCRDVARVPLMALYQDYDWADEVIHARFGYRWITVAMFGGDAAAAKRYADQAMDRRRVWAGRHNAEAMAAGVPAERIRHRIGFDSFGEILQGRGRGTAAEGGAGTAGPGAVR